MKDVEVYLYLHGITRSRATLSSGSSRINMLRIDTDDIIDLVPVTGLSADGVARVLVRIPWEVAQRHSIEPKTVRTSSLYDSMASDGAIGTADGPIQNDDRVEKEFVEKVMLSLDSSFRSGLDNLGQKSTQFPGLKQTRARSLNRQLQDDALNMEAAMLDDSDFSEHHE